MIIPPIEPTPPISGSPPQGEIPLRDRVQNALLSIQLTHAELQSSLVAKDSPEHIESLMQKLQKPIQDLLQLTKQHPPVLSQNEMDVVKSLNLHYEAMQTDPQSISPSTLAALQGNATSLEQLFAAEVAGIPEPNVHALQSQNYLSTLSDALHLQVQAHRSSGEAQALINSMQHPLDELSNLSKSGVLTPDQSNTVVSLTTTFTTALLVPEKVTLESIAQFKTNLTNLNRLLTNS